MKRKTKNYIEYKKKYVTDLNGYKFAPYNVSITYTTDYCYCYCADCTACNGESEKFIKNLVELAERNTGVKVYTDGEGAEFNFFTEKGLKQFVKKAKDRYEADRDFNVQIMKAEVSYEEVEL